ncbi:DUF3027 domain-containing protein [Nocardioides panacisoli]|uniref:DUF3027 domain-containing protein n=1 Tax=Nocardioides panacisoli TaxID=627624 RepID=UPI001C631ECC|nr:DUF3027 domain-containing protein [Nocardioides panacisoli]QYJ02668.1 DUF3027 domain-containing protein [Nocardioides panacisoli]
MTVAARHRVDTAAAAAVDQAHAALVEEVPAADVGPHLGTVGEGQRVVTHRFACERAGYTGWHWAVTVTRASRQRRVTVDEVVLLPGEDAITAPDWVPYRDRIQPGDLSPGDLLPVADDDPRLVPTYSFGDDPLDADDKAQIRTVAKDLGLGRVRTMSPEGRAGTAERWLANNAGPDAPLARSAPESCHSCGFLVRLAGPLADRFGVCANGDANDDGKVVAFDHGCGAHSEVRLAKKHRARPLPEHVFDTLTLDELELF